MTAVIIVANHRTGSSCLASVLQALGVQMIPTAEPINPGDMAWEDQTFVELHRKIFGEVTGEHYNPDAWRYPTLRFTPQIFAEYKTALRDRAKQMLWGFKDPRTVFTLPFVMGLAVGMELDVRLIWLKRDVGHVAESLRQREGQYYPTDFNAVALHQRREWEAVLSEYYDSYPSLELSYETMTTDPMKTVIDILPMIAPHYPSQANINKAIGLIRSPK